MFGFLGASCRSCSEEAADLYQSYFCGLCNNLRGRYGIWTRWLINRDSTFVALLASSQSTSVPESTITTCCNPLGKKRDLFQCGVHADYAAAVTMCGLNTAIKDANEDERGWRSFLAGWLAKVTDPASRRARQTLRELGFPEREVTSRLAEQEACEREFVENPPQDFGLVAEPTANAFGEILGHTALLANASGNKASLRAAGRHLGSLVYLWDAWEDFDKDVARQRFNPLVTAMGPNSNLAERRERLAPRMREHWLGMRDSLAALELPRNRELVEEILLQSTAKKLAGFGIQGIAGEDRSESAGLLPGETKQRKVKRSRRGEGRERRWYDWCCCDCCECACIHGDWHVCNSCGSCGGASCCSCSSCDCGS